MNDNNVYIGSGGGGGGGGGGYLFIVHDRDASMKCVLLLGNSSLPT